MDRKMFSKYLDMRGGNDGLARIESMLQSMYIGADMILLVVLRRFTRSDFQRESRWIFIIRRLTTVRFCFKGH